MYNTIMELIIALLIGFTVGFTVAWLVKPKNNASPEIMRILDDRMLAGFKVISADILKQQTAQSRELVVTPALAEMHKIKTEFDRKIGEMNKEVIESRSGTKQHIEVLANYSREFEKFFNAFRGQKKLQGNWGEAILESTLGLIGFRKGFEFNTQVAATDEKGNRFVLDCVLNLPDDKKIIIDSKVSLVSYMDYTNTDDDRQKRFHLDSLVKATTNHIDSLSSKEYQKKLADYNMDFIFMLIPSEEIYFKILETEPKIHEYAIKKKIAIVTPSLLYPMMRTMNSLINMDKYSKDINDVIEMVNKLYEKYTGFTENFAKIKDKLDDATNAYTAAVGQLATGNGNMGGWMEKIKKKSRIITNKTTAITAENSDE